MTDKLSTAPSTMKVDPLWLESREGSGNGLFRAWHQFETTHQRLQRLLGAASKETGTADEFWNARARGTRVSHRQYVADTLYDYLEARLDIEYGLLRLPRQGWRWGRELIEKARRDGPAEITPSWLPALGTKYHYVYVDVPDEDSDTLPGSIVVSRGGAYLLFTLGWDRGAVWFSNRSNLEAFLLDNRVSLWEGMYTVEQLEQAQEIVFSELLRNPFEVVFESAQRRWDKHPEYLSSLLARDLSTADRNQIQERMAREGHSDRALINFGSLDEALALAYREAAVERQEEAILTYLGESPRSDAAQFRLGLLMQDSLDATHHRNEASGRLKALLSASNALGWVAQGDAAFLTCCNDRAQGVVDEARLQHKLGILTLAQQAMVEEVVFSSDADGYAGRQTQVFDLTVHDWKIAGALILVDENGDGGPDEQTSALLYMPGLQGGLLAFANVGALKEALVDTLLARTESVFRDNVPFDQAQAIDDYLNKCLDEGLDVALSLVKVTGKPFIQSLKDQLTHFPRHARAISAGTASYPDTASTAESQGFLESQTFTKLAIPVNEAREVALERVAEQLRTVPAAEQIKQRFDQLPEADRTAVQNNLAAYRTAFIGARELLRQELPDRETFVDGLIRQRLESDIGMIWPFQVILDLPESVREETVLGPDIPTAVGERPSGKIEYLPSDDWVQMTLSDLALANIDDAMKRRLSFMEVIINSPIASNASLGGKLSQHYVKQLVKSLDAAGEYEKRITSAYRLPVGSAFVRELHRERLELPWQLLLKVELLLVKGRGMSTSTYRLLEQLADGSTPAQLLSQGLDINIQTATLFPGRDALGGTSEVALSGLLFLVNQQTDATILYLPGTPRGNAFREYSSLEQAQMALADMTLDAVMLNYLAAHADDGNADAHAAKVRRALRSGFRSFVGASSPWPMSTSLPTHLCNLEMGRLVTAHRASSRSNRELYLEEAALEHQAIYGYLKMTLGFMPILGSVISVYDFWIAANGAVNAFLQGRVNEGIDHLASAMMSLVDVVLDVAPGVVGAGRFTKVKRLQGIARQRQITFKLGHDGSVALTPKAASSSGRVRHYAYDAFEGRQSKMALYGKTRIDAGQAKGTYSVGSKHYIQRDGLTYEVEWDASYRTWRLAKTPSHFYRQPIRLGDDGRWVTHGQFSGRLVDGGLQGGGPVLSMLRDIWGGGGRGRQAAIARQAVDEVVDAAARVPSVPAGSRGLKPAALKKKIEQAKKAVSEGQGGFAQADSAFTALGAGEEAFKDAVDAAIKNYKSSLNTLGELGSPGSAANLASAYQGVQKEFRKFQTAMNRRLGGDSEFTGLMRTVDGGIGSFANRTSIEAADLSGVSKALDSLSERFEVISAGADQKLWQKVPDRFPGASPKKETAKLATETDSFIAKLADRKTGLQTLKSGIEGKAAQKRANDLAGECAFRHKQIQEDQLLSTVDRERLLSSLSSEKSNLTKLADELLVKHSFTQNITEEAVETLLNRKAIKVNQGRELPNKVNRNGETDIVVEYPLRIGKGIAGYAENTDYAFMHLHYKQKPYRLEDFVAVHFKTPEQRGMGGGGVYRKAATTAFVKTYLAPHQPK
ncbi:hypothetical protein NVV94_17040 [Pseudomonas sp. LS1212]|uniref:dermonecrotic toxin domain-containing protein n=1 Tax=Pseudomonas sp. LS1212 TaxID=2972478 RepID=UPI00215BDB9B|nr:DUF6543 domain-containing protein [Pseudomonas sp. LS1212]UVJ42338.1 hypothetical protein NVV94_17040 [Pseudomonas sp. LS1212]